MTTQDFTTTIVVPASSAEAFQAINNVPGWWTAHFEGSTGALHEAFTVRFGEVFITMNVEELLPDQKITWCVQDCYKPWLVNKQEWNGTKICWEIATDGGSTQITMTHLGLIPGIECYKGCAGAWTSYIQESLFQLLMEGIGQPG